jgi:hypothetical protein
MTETTKKNLGKKLAKYGALTLAIAGIADATGQVNYTDVDPDFEGGMGDSFAIDFDSDGTDDLTVLQSNNGNYELVQANASSAGNGIARFDAMNSYTYASNVVLGDPIDGNLTFASFGSACAGPGYAGSQFCGLGEGFIGVEFAAGGNTHYGWVRIDVADSGNFIVMDYAFDATPGAAIAAGDSTLGTDDSQFTGFVQFVSDNQLNLKANTTMSSAAVYDITGKQVITQNLSTTNAQVNLAGLNTGVYIARVTIDGAEKTFKFVK